jgi:hypothetical protein
MAGGDAGGLIVHCPGRADDTAPHAGAAAKSIQDDTTGIHCRETASTLPGLTPGDTVKSTRFYESVVKGDRVSIFGKLGMIYPYMTII